MQYTRLVFSHELHYFESHRRSIFHSLLLPNGFVALLSLFMHVPSTEFHLFQFEKLQPTLRSASEWMVFVLDTTPLFDLQKLGSRLCGLIKSQDGRVLFFKCVGLTLVVWKWSTLQGYTDVRTTALTMHWQYWAVWMEMVWEVCLPEEKLLASEFEKFPIPIHSPCHCVSNQPLVWGLEWWQLQCIAMHCNWWPTRSIYGPLSA